MSTITTVLPIWQALQERFHKTVKVLPEQDLQLKIGSSSIASLIWHNAEVEYMFAEWFFGRAIPEQAKHLLNRDTREVDLLATDVSQLARMLTASNTNLIEAMRELSDEAWHHGVESPMGVSTPLEAIGRLMYHTGIHSGQISLIQKNAARRV